MTFFVIIRGPLGCGKTTISKLVAQKLKGKYISVDEVLEKHDLIQDWEDGYIAQKSFQKVNDFIVPKAKKDLEKGTPVIFDGNFYWKSQIEYLIGKLDPPHYVFTLQAPLKVCLERDQNRPKTLGADATKAVYKKSTEFDAGEVIDVTKPVNEIVEDIVKVINKQKMKRNKLLFRKNCEGYFITKDKKVLAQNTGKGYLIFPGGGIDAGESPETAVLRETLEETSATIKSLKKLETINFIWDKNWAKTEKQKRRYTRFKGEEMHLFSGTIKEFIKPNEKHEDLWEGGKLMALSEAIKFIEESKPFSNNVKLYRKTQLKWLKKLLNN